MRIIADCGHEFDLGYTAAEVRGATVDCPACNELLILPRGGELEAGQFRAHRFHAYMHEQNPIWPADGNGTGCIDLANDGNAAP